VRAWDRGNRKEVKKQVRNGAKKSTLRVRKFSGDVADWLKLRVLGREFVKDM
jgi:hypothetical protein